jgi:NitT/TauT family transport system substrate-binding protein
MHRRSVLGLVAAGLIAGGVAQAADLGTVRIGVLQFGTVNWEMDVIKHHGLDREAGFTLEVVPFGNNDAADVALLGGAVDGIVEDWLFVSRQRSEGEPLVFVPYSSSVGSLMVRSDSGIASLADLAGKKIGVAGGAIDKSWLILQGYARQEGIDLAAAAEPVYGAPPLLTEKFRQGELPAILNYWHFAARLEAEGAIELTSVAEAQAGLGVPADTVQLGYVFKESWAAANPELLQAFAGASRSAKRVMRDSDPEWERLRPLTRAENDAVLAALRDRYREGIPERWGEPERAAAAKLYAVLAELGGERLVGSSKELAPGTFWHGVSY